MASYPYLMDYRMPQKLKETRQKELDRDVASWLQLAFQDGKEREAGALLVARNIVSRAQRIYLGDYRNSSCSARS